MNLHIPFRMLCLSLSLLLAGLAFSACSDDEPASLRPVLPTNGGSSVRSIAHLGSVPSCYDWQLSYSGGRLTKAVGVVRDPSPAIDQSFRYTSNLSYQYRGVIIRNSSKEDTKVTLNDRGYIQTMTVNRNIYNFRYNSEGRLSGWDKVVFEDSFGQVHQYRSSATIEYHEGNYSRIVYTEAGDQSVTLTFTPSASLNRNGLLPTTATRELGCLGFEHLYYAGLLGLSTRNLVAAIRYEYGDSQNDFQTYFEYGTKDGNTVLCNYHTKDGNVASVSYGY